MQEERDTHAPRALAADCDVEELHAVWVVQTLQELDLAQRRDWELSTAIESECVYADTADYKRTT